MSTKFILSTIVVSETLTKFGDSFNIANFKPKTEYYSKYIKDDVEALSHDWSVVGEEVRNAIDDFGKINKLGTNSDKRLCESSV